MGIAPFDAAAWAKEHRIAPQDAVRRLADLLLQEDLAPEARSLALEAGRDVESDGLRKALQILMNCPEFQLA
jgi:hypothetical protein